MELRQHLEMAGKMRKHSRDEHDVAEALSDLRNMSAVPSTISSPACSAPSSPRMHCKKRRHSEDSSELGHPTTVGSERTAFDDLRWHNRIAHIGATALGKHILGHECIRNLRYFLVWLQVRKC